MSKDLIIIFLGAWVALVPFLGFPSNWDTIIFVISGLLIIAFMFMLRKDFLKHLTKIKSRSPLHDEHVFAETVVAGEAVEEIHPPHEHNHSPHEEHENHDHPEHNDLPHHPPPPRAKHASVKRKSKKLKINEEVKEEAE